MRVAVLCERSGVVRDAFTKRGHIAWSCDTEPSDRPGRHVRGRIEDYDWSGFDLIIGFPPCTRLCNSGVHLLAKRNLWAAMREAAAFFRSILELPCARIAVENPVPHGYAVKEIGRTYDQTIQPYQFGHPESKRTCLWLRGLPKLQPTCVLEKPACGYWNNQTPSGQNKHGPSKDRSYLRAITYQGIADAMADQWGR